MATLYESASVHAAGQYGSVRWSTVGEQPKAQEPEDLTRRELEVLALIAEGLTNRGIGDRLVVSARTVQAHVRNLVEKTRTRNRTHLAVTALRTGMIRDARRRPDRPSGA